MWINVCNSIHIAGYPCFKQITFDHIKNQFINLNININIENGISVQDSIVD
jgi:hypothetical protein